jgi:hypothetical protein
VKVYISKYRDHWISPYTILEKIVFWREIDYDEPRIEWWSNKLTPLCQGLQSFLNKIRPEIRYVKIDKWDTWSMDHTLAHIVLPMLKQLRDTKHGSPNVDDEDVPERLRSTSAPPKENDWDTDTLWHDRWTWVINEMIFAFESELSDWEEKFYSGEIDTIWAPVDREGNEVPKKDAVLFQMKNGPNHTFDIDVEGRKQYQERINNGFRLFGKYYSSLWD